MNTAKKLDFPHAFSQLAALVRIAEIEGHRMDTFETSCNVYQQYIDEGKQAMEYFDLEHARTLELEQKIERLEKIEAAALELYYMAINAGDFRNGNTYRGIDEGAVMAEKVFAKFRQALKDGDSDGNG